MDINPRPQTRLSNQSHRLSAFAAAGAWVDYVLGQSARSLCCCEAVPTKAAHIDITKMSIFKKIVWSVQGSSEIDFTSDLQCRLNVARMFITRFRLTMKTIEQSVKIALQFRKASVDM